MFQRITPDQALRISVIVAQTIQGSMGKFEAQQYIEHPRETGSAFRKALREDCPVCPQADQVAERDRIGNLKEFSLFTSRWIHQCILDSQMAAFRDSGVEVDMTLARPIIESYIDLIPLWLSFGLVVKVFAPTTQLSMPRRYRQHLDQRKLTRRNLSGELELVTNTHLDGAVVLIDPRRKPRNVASLEGPMWADDDYYLGPVISELRQSGILKSPEIGHKDFPPGSRFYISPEDWECHLRAATATRLGLSTQQVRLETAVEFTAIPHLYPNLPRSSDGETNTSVWLEEQISGGQLIPGGFRLMAGNSEGIDREDRCQVKDGLEYLEGIPASNRMVDVAIRPIAVLGIWAPRR